MKQIGKFLVRDKLQEFADPRVSALVIIDLQNDFCHSDGIYARCGMDLSSISRMLPNAIALIEQAQSLGIRCVFIRQITLANAMSDSASWIRFKVRDGKSAEYALEGSWGADLIDELTPVAADIIVDKFRPDAFHHTPLEPILRANQVESLLMLGVLTEGCVESTVRAASYRDFYTVVVDDCVASTNALNHEGSMNLFRARYTMASSRQLLNVWHKHLRG